MTTPPTARDVARELLYSIITTTSVIKREYWEEEMLKDIAAALAAARRETVEACCKAVCKRCNSGVPVEVIVRPHGPVYHWHKENDQWSGGPCDAFLIRAAIRSDQMGAGKE